MECPHIQTYSYKTRPETQSKIVDIRRDPVDLRVEIQTIQQFRVSFVRTLCRQCGAQIGEDTPLLKYINTIEVRVPLRSY